MQAVSRAIAVGPACLAAPVRTLDLRASTSFGQAAALRSVRVCAPKRFAGRQLPAEQRSEHGFARGGALAVEAKAVTVLAPVGEPTYTA